MDRYEMLKTVNGDLLGECTELRKRIDFYRNYFGQQDNVVCKEKSDGCEYCTGDVDDRPYLNGTSLYIDDNGHVFNTNTGDSFKIYFCPMCGRKLD